jgi:hypothetical protein
MGVMILVCLYKSKNEKKKIPRPRKDEETAKDANQGRRMAESSVAYWQLASK